MQLGMLNEEIDEPLKEVLRRLQTCQYRLLSVTEDARLVGIINIDNITLLSR